MPEKQLIPRMKERFVAVKDDMVLFEGAVFDNGAINAYAVPGIVRGEFVSVGLKDRAALENASWFEGLSYKPFKGITRKDYHPQSFPVISLERGKKLFIEPIEQEFEALPIYTRIPEGQDLKYAEVTKMDCLCYHGRDLAGIVAAKWNQGPFEVVGRLVMLGDTYRVVVKVKE